MGYIGLDIGTSTISGLLMDEKGFERKRRTLPNTAQLPAAAPWMNLQSPQIILALCQKVIDDLLDGEQQAVRCIGITGQMHGIVYVDRQGKACSALATWQDERGNAFLEEGKTYCQRIHELSGGAVATGFGVTTLFYDTLNDLVPKNAVSVCTITDYVAMRLAQRKTPLVHPSNAASLGLFSLSNMSFEWDKIASLRIDEKLLPAVTQEECVIGETPSGVAVAVAIGDNQSSFLGSVGRGTDTLINIGTGSQISRLSSVPHCYEGLECRPYIGNQYLLAGSSLCGGSAYNLLVDLFTEVAQLLTGVTPQQVIQKMDRAAEQAAQSGASPLRVDTRFRGTRDRPDVRGAITNIGANNFSPGSLCYSFLRGVCDELHDFYEKMNPEVKPAFFAISGNAARNSSVLRWMIRQVFGAEVRVPQNAEEAASGAALLSIHASENRGWDEILDMVRYE